MSNFIDENGSLSDPYKNFIALSRYARWDDELNRRETWTETVDRYSKFFQEYLDTKYPLATQEIDMGEIASYIKDHKVMPSMRSLMTAGPALQRCNVGSYNCSFLGVDSLRSFDEAMYILMCGTGVGFSVESKYVDKLPVINEHFESSETTIVVGDSKAGWARALRELLSLLQAGQIPTWDVSKVRPAGARLKTFGGRASGPEPLERLFKFCVEVFKGAAGRKLKPIEAHDIMCKIGEIVVVGGVRRCLLDYTDVTTPTGFVKMKDIAVGDEIVSGGRKAHVTAKMDSGKQLTVIVNHQYGKSEMTPNHRIAVFDGIDSYTFKEAGDLVPGDRLVWDLVGYYGDIQALPRPSYTGHFNAKPFTVPDIVDTDVAWLVGLVHGDGHVHAKGIEISSNGEEWATLERANAIFADKFGVGGKVGRDSHDGKGIRLRVNSTGLALWFAENVKLPNEPIRVPSFIMRAQPDVRAAYLAGVLDSDGRIRSDGVIEQATSVYQEFIDDLRLVNMSLGLTLKVVERSAQHRRDRGENAKDFQTLNVAGRTSRDSFINIVGPYSDKMDGLDVSKSGSPKDFTYPAEWRVGYHSRNTQRTTLVQKGLLESDYPFAPVEVISVEIGSVQQTWDIEVADIHEFTADGLVTHNSAMISLSNLEDYDMAKAKSGSWWDTNGQRALANNSAVYESKPGVGEFLKEWRHLYDSKSGERGIFSLDNAKAKASSNGRRDGSKIAGLNPCGEILLRNKGFCNLSEVIVEQSDTLETLKDKVRVATIIGTIQSTMTDFKYLRKVWRDNAEEERLLGVSLTGQFGHPVLSGSEGHERLRLWLSEMKQVAIDVNREFAEILGINVSAAITTVKPSGTVSQLTGVASGMHPWHSQQYIRSVRGDNKDPLTQFLIHAGIPSEPEFLKPLDTTVFYFPVKAPDGSITRNDISAIEHLEIWKVYKDYWTEHNPSITVTVRDEEWVDVAAWVYKNWSSIGGISFLPHSDHTYRQAPYQEVSSQEFEEFLEKMPDHIHWSELSFYEIEDATSGSQELACVAGACDVVDIVSMSSNEQ